MADIVWGNKYSVYPFTIKVNGEDKSGEIIVFDKVKTGTKVKFDGQEWQFKNFTQAMKYITVELFK